MATPPHQTAGFRERTTNRRARVIKTYKMTPLTNEHHNHDNHPGVTRPDKITTRRVGQKNALNIALPEALQAGCIRDKHKAVNPSQATTLTLKPTPTKCRNVASATASGQPNRLTASRTSVPDSTTPPPSRPASETMNVTHAMGVSIGLDAMKPMQLIAVSPPARSPSSQDELGGLIVFPVAYRCLAAR